MSSKRIGTMEQALRILDEASGRSVKKLKRKLKGEMIVMAPKIEKQLRTMKDGAVKKLHVVRDETVKKSKKAARAIDKEAHKRPWTFVGVFAAFAAFFGFLLGRKSKR